MKSKRDGVLKNMSTEETTLFDLGEKVKRCTGCGNVKPSRAFGRRKDGKDGLLSHCRECQKLKDAVQKQRYREANAGKNPYDGKPKRCSGCKVEKPRTTENWKRYEAAKDGLFFYCRPCENRRVSKIDGDIVERVDYLWRKEKRSGRGEWIGHSTGEWLDLLISQRGRCALSNVELTPSNVSIDHIVPCGKGGTHELSNLRLVTQQVNTALWDGSDENLFEMARALWFARMNLLFYGTKENPGA